MVKVMEYKILAQQLLHRNRWKSTVDIENMDVVARRRVLFICEEFICIQKKYRYLGCWET